MNTPTPTPTVPSTLPQLKDCTKCSLRANVSCPVSGQGPAPADIMLIGEAVGKLEAAMQKPFTGPASPILDKILTAAGIDRSAIYITNLVKCFPKAGNAIPGGKEHRPPKSAEIKACSPYLLEEIKQVKPKLIIAAGNAPLKFLLGRTYNVSTQRGAVVWVPQFNAHVLTIFHPAALLHHPEYYTVTVDDLKRGKAALDGSGTEPEKFKTDYVFCTTFDQVIGVFNAMEVAPAIAYDIETTGFDFLTDKLICIGFSWAKGKAACIPFHKEDGSWYWSGTEAETIWSRMRKLFSSDKVKISHNGKFDNKFLKTYGVDIAAPQFDTFLAHHLLDENAQGMHGLKALAWQFTDMGGYERALEEYMRLNKVGKEFRAVPRPILAKYNCFEKHTRISLADGTFKTIGEIVEKRLPVSVLSYNLQTKRIEIKRVTNWFKNHQKMEEYVSQPPTKKEWYKVRTGYKSQGILHCSPKHKFYIEGKGYTPASKLQPLDKALILEPQLNSSQKQLLLGSLLGDGHLNRNKDSKALAFTVSHCSKQAEYTHFCHQLLQPFGVSAVRKYKQSEKGWSKKGSYLYTVTSRSSSFQFQPFDLYAEGCKQPSTEYLEQLGDMGLAFWYMDDGHFAYNINASGKKVGQFTLATYGFDGSALKRIADWFNRKYGVTASLYSQKMASGIGHGLRFSRSDSEILFKRIRKYVIPAMQYKLPTKHLGFFSKTSFDWSCAPVTPLPIVSSEPCTEEYIQPKRARGKFVESYYDIEVEGNHNYFANKTLVSNCGDADCTLRLYTIFKDKLEEEKLTKLFQQITMPLSAALTDMEYVGTQVDTAYLSKLTSEYAERLESLKTQILEKVGHEVNLNSPKQLQNLLFNELGLEPVGTTPSGAPSTDEEALTVFAKKHPIPKLLLEYRKADKLHSTYMVGLGNLLDKNGVVHPSFKVSGTQCVTKDSLIWTQQGLQFIEDLAKDKPEGFSPFKIKLLSHEGERNTSHLLRKVASITYELQTTFNLSLRCTPEHPLYVLREGKLQWISAEQVVKGDFIATASASSYFGTQVALPSYTPTYKTNSIDTFIPPLHLTPELARLIGYYVAEGNIRDNAGTTWVCIANKDANVLKDVRAIFKQLRVNSKYDSAANIEVVVGVNFGRWFKQLVDFTKSGAGRKVVPAVIRQAPKELVIEFLRGYTANAFIGTASTGKASCKKPLVRYNTTSEKVAKVIQQFLINLGYGAKLRTMPYNCFKRHTKEQYEIPFKYQINITSNEAIRFVQEIVPVCTPHLKKMSQWVPSRIARPVYSRWHQEGKNKYKLVRITGKKLLKEPVEVFDLTVPKSHSFVANGLIVHNTGRLACSDPNLQNIPHTDEIRNLFTARPGCLLIQSDFSAAEFKAWAHYSQDPRMIEDIVAGVDIHYKVAAAVYKIPIDQVTDEQRKNAKGCVFGLMYGRGANSVSKEFGFSVKVANDIISTFFKMYPKASAWLTATEMEVKQKGYLRNFFGRVRRLPGVYSTVDKLKAEALRQSRNFPIQSLVADLTNFSIVRLHKRLAETYPHAKILIQVHDALIVEAREQEAIQVAALVKQEMCKPITGLRIPFGAKVEMGKAWGSLKKCNV